MAHMGVNEKCVCGFSEGNLKGRDPMRELDLNWRTIKKTILKKKDVREWA